MGNGYNGVVAQGTDITFPTGDHFVTAARVANAEARQNGQSFSSNRQQIPEVAPSLQGVEMSEFGNLHQGIVKFLSPEGRGYILGSAPLPDLLTLDSGLSGLVKFYYDRDLEGKLSEYMLRAFGEPLFVNRHSGGTVHLQIRSVDLNEPKVGEMAQYSKIAAELPKVSAQGAGIQAFMGTILTVLLGEFTTLLLDLWTQRNARGTHLSTQRGMMRGRRWSIGVTRRAITRSAPTAYD